jgi:phosphatidate cytidylyltransferase
MTPAKARWGDLRTRILSAAIMVPVALACIVVGGGAFALLVALVTIGLAYEWLRMCRIDAGPGTVLMFAALPLSVCVAALDHPGFAIGLLLLVTVAAVMRPPGSRSANPTHLAILPFGVPYLGIGAIALVWLRFLPDIGAAAVIVLLLVIWASDIGAYVVGRAVGGPKLAPRISPGKTWSGAIGGLVAAVAVGVAAAGWFGAWDRAPLAAIAAAVIGCIGQAGDLFESGLKRHFNVKDSGALIPGHGGLLDRLDAVLTAAPAAAILALLMGGGVIRW